MEDILKVGFRSGPAELAPCFRGSLRLPLCGHKMSCLVGLLLFLTCSVTAHAGHLYIAQSARGSDTGADAANAHSAAWFNTAGNWGSGTGKVNPGDTVHLAGNITTALTVQASGSAGNITTILFDPGATMSKPAWAVNAITISGKSYITVDGGATGTIGGPNGNSGLANGIIENTDNGVGLGNQVSNGSGISATTGSNITVKGLVVRKLFMRTAGTDQASLGNQGVKFDGISNGLVTNCIFHDNERGVIFFFRAGNTNLEYSFSTAYNCNWGGAAGSGGSNNDLTGLLVHDNRFYNWSNWDDTSVVNRYHHNGFFAFTSLLQTNTRLTTVRYYNNFIGPGWGTRSSSGLWVQDKVYDVETYNNVVVSDANGYPPNGLVGFNPQGAISSSWRVYNNTLIGGGSGAAIYAAAWQNSGGTSTIALRNNLVSGTRFFATIYYSASLAIESDHNIGFNMDATTPFSYSSTGSGSFKTLAQWKGFGFDADFLLADPIVDGDYKISGLSPAKGMGANLSERFTIDMAGVSRASSGAWDAGAYVARPSKPGGLHIAH